MGALLRCKVRDITGKNDAARRWEIRFEKRVLPVSVEKMAGKLIKLKFTDREYVARAGIAAKGGPNQYFWINTRKDEAGSLMNILRAHGYQPKYEIILHQDKLTCIVLREV